MGKKVLVNLMMDTETQAQMDSFLLRNTTVDLPAIVERFLVQFMLHYESQVELDHMYAHGVDLEPISTQTLPESQLPTITQEAWGRMQTASSPMQLPMLSSPLTPMEDWELHKLQTNGLASLLPPSRGGATNGLMSQKPSDAPAASSSTPLDPTTGSAPSVEDSTAFKTHVFQRGETLFGLAQQFNISTDDLYEANKFLMRSIAPVSPNGEELVGLELIIPDPEVDE